ncbi:hypothetical protein Tcan_07688 [Toxocara canis]|uniref:Uncharacterized protein n=1 Tax=Toxocara canis TaxID=6265 RepID=A0A0B2UU08_TOXCA|nr:hypothetical protein Tcan_07688 [Toxocara canis]
MGSFVFAESQIRQMTFEEVRMTANELSFAGIDVRNLLMMRCRWRNKRVREAIRFRPQSIGHLHLTNSSVDRLVLAMFFNTTHIQLQSTHIGELASTSSLRLRNVRRVEIADSTIRQWNSNALHNANRVKLFEVINSHIGNMVERGARNAHIERMSFTRTSMDRIGSLTFEKSRIDTLTWTECHIGAVAQNAFTNMVVQTILFSTNKFVSMATNCFAEMVVTNFLIVSSQIAQIGSSPFANAEVNNLTIHNNEFVCGDLSTIFFRLKSPTLIVTNNIFGCDANDCETNALLLSDSGQRSMPWHFEHNSCIGDQTNVCVREREWTEGNVRCRARHEIVECVCIDDTLMGIMPSTNASVMLIGDCSRLHLNAVATSTVASLHIYRAEVLEVDSLPPLLKTLQIFHSKIENIAENAFAHLSLKRMEMIATHVATVKRHAFRRSTMHSFILRDSTIAHVEHGAFADSTINYFFAESCKFYSVGDMWSRTKNISISESFVADVRPLLQSHTFCFHDSMTACACVSDEFNEKNTCESRTVTCASGGRSWNEDACSESAQESSNGRSSSITATITILIFESKITVLLPLYGLYRKLSAPYLLFLHFSLL